MTFSGRWSVSVYWGLTLGLLCAGVVMVVTAPVHPQLGAIQKLLYIHLPVAANTLIFAFTVFVASVAFLGGRSQRWDALAHATAEMTLLNGTILLLTGVVWAKVSWGQWWIWSPRLAISLILWVVYATYLLVRHRLSQSQRAATVGSIYGIVAFLNVPLLYLSVKLLPDIHPATAGLGPGTYGTLLTWFAGITMFSVGATATSFRLFRMDLRDGDLPTGNGHSAGAPA
ncbi:MAG: cytochrome c biogenesis protein CcsA [Phycisphaerales bacterium]